MNIRIRSFLAIVLGLVAAIAAQLTPAQTYPARPIRMIIPWPPGGGTDVLGRIICQRLAEQLGQQIVVDNRGGASTIIGTEILAKGVPGGRVPAHRHAVPARIPAPECGGRRPCLPLLPTQPPPPRLRSSTSLASPPTRSRWSVGWLSPTPTTEN